MTLQITIIELGLFATRMVSGSDEGTPRPIPPAYDTPTSPTKILREILATPNHPARPVAGDPEKAVEQIYKLTQVENPPYQLPIGQDAVQLIRNKLEEQLKEVVAYESWSSNL
jgi:hypothetical protein